MSLSSMGIYGEALALFKSCLDAHIMDSLQCESSNDGNSGMIKLDKLLQGCATNLEGMILCDFFITKQIMDRSYLLTYMSYLLSCFSFQFHFVACDDVEFSKRLWKAAKQRKIKNSMTMSSVYLYRGKSSSPIEVHFKYGIFLNLDGVKETDMPAIAPSRFSFFTPDKEKDPIQPASMPMPSTPSCADVQVSFDTKYAFHVSIILFFWEITCPTFLNIQLIDYSFHS